jgi:hypothetical protein
MVLSTEAYGVDLAMRVSASCMPSKAVTVALKVARAAGRAGRAASHWTHWLLQARQGTTGNQRTKEEARDFAHK